MEKTILVRLTEQDALDLSLLITEKRADLLHKKRNQGLTVSESRTFESLQMIQDRIGVKVMALHREDDRPALRVIDGKTQD